MYPLIIWLQINICLPDTRTIIQKQTLTSMNNWTLNRLLSFNKITVQPENWGTSGMTEIMCELQTY